MKRPVTIITGFLGSGKTTLLSRLLTGPGTRNAAVLVNEFGEAGLDHHLLRRVEERTVLLGGGCVCCATREDLVDALLELLNLDESGGASVERVVIETTGLAEPAPILHTIYAHPVLSHHFFVQLVISTVDALSGETNLDHSPEATKQAASSDRIVVTKTDAAEPETARRLTDRLRRLNPPARIFEASFGEVDAEALLEPSPEPVQIPDRPIASHDTADAHTVSLTFDGPVDWAAFGVWLSMLLHARGESVLRVKGLLDVGEAGPVVLDGVQHTIHPPEHLAAWPAGEHRSRLTFITRSVRSEEILDSLETFADLLGARPLRLGAGQPAL